MFSSMLIGSVLRRQRQLPVAIPACLIVRLVGDGLGDFLISAILEIDAGHGPRRNYALKKIGIFITLEGIDGSGKSTQHRLLAQYLRKRGHQVTATREPGGTMVGEQIRDILLASKTRKLAPVAELLLMYSARAQHLQEVVRPARARGEIVLSDRFSDASMAYQGYGRKLGEAAVSAIDRIVCGGTKPDLTLVLDLSPRLALKRARSRETQSKSQHGRFEVQGLRFHQRVRRGYLAIAKKEAARVKVIDANQSVAALQGEIRAQVDLLLARRRKRMANGKSQM
jgi:dTMP kinase